MPVVDIITLVVGIFMPKRVLCGHFDATKGSVLPN